MKRLLAALCGLLVATIAVEVSYGTGHDNAPGQAAAGTGNVDHATPQHIAPAEDWVAQWTEVALARPLFAPDRKPEAGSSAASAGLPRLTGIIASSDDAVAIFQPTGNGKPVAVRHGETVAGWEVTAIGANQVGLRKASDRLVLRPELEHAASGSAANEVKRPPSRWEVAAPTGMLRARWSNPQLQP